MEVIIIQQTWNIRPGARERVEGTNTMFLIAYYQVPRPTQRHLIWAHCSELYTIEG